MKTTLQVIRDEYGNDAAWEALAERNIQKTMPDDWRYLVQSLKLTPPQPKPEPAPEPEKVEEPEPAPEPEETPKPKAKKATKAAK